MTQAAINECSGICASLRASSARRAASSRPRRQQVSRWLVFGDEVMLRYYGMSRPSGASGCFGDDGFSTAERRAFYEAMSYMRPAADAQLAAKAERYRPVESAAVRRNERWL